MLNKINYSENIFYELEIPSTHQVVVKPSNLITFDKVLARNTNISDEIKIKYTGKAFVKEGDDIEVGDLIAKNKGLGRKIKSKINGKIVKVEHDLIYIEESKPSILKEKDSPVRASIKVPHLVKEVYEKSILLQLPGIIINLFAVKGNNSIGDLHFIKYKKSVEHKNQFGVNYKNIDLSSDLENKIVIINHLFAEIYSKLVTIGVTGIIANTIDYTDFDNINSINVPIGIFTGFGSNVEISKINNKFSSNYNLLELLKKFEGDKIIIDSDYNRVILPLQNKPSIFMSNHEFKLPFN